MLASEPGRDNGYFYLEDWAGVAMRRRHRTDLYAGTLRAPLPAVQAGAAELLAVEPAGLPAEVLRSLLPERVRPANAARLGRELSARPDRFESVRDRDGRRWRAVTPAVTDAAAPVTEPDSRVVTGTRTPEARGLAAARPGASSSPCPDAAASPTHSRR
jgi:hypothetical protein